MPLIKLRDFPGVGSLEWALEQRSPERSPVCLHGYGDAEDLAERAHDLAEHLFGISEYDIEDIEDDIESHFEEVRRLYRDEADEYWARYGWDVTDGNGKQLLVMKYFLEPLVCLVKGLHPDARFDAATDAWGSKLEEEAKRFRPSR